MLGNTVLPSILLMGYEKNFLGFLESDFELL